MPQATYFTGEKKAAERSFDLVQEKDGVKIAFPKLIDGEYVFINVEGDNGVLEGYYKVWPDSTGIKLLNRDFGKGKKLNVSYNGFYDSCPVAGSGGEINLLTNWANTQNGTFKPVKEEGWQKTSFFQYDYNIHTNSWNGFNRHFAFGRRWMYGKTYKIGMGLGLDWNRYVFIDRDSDIFPLHDRIIMRNMQVRGEVMQRIVFRRMGLNWDLGVYGGINITRRVKVVDYALFDDQGHPFPSDSYTKKTSMYYGAKAMNLFEYGAMTRISYSIANIINIGIYGGYRLSPVITKSDEYFLDPVKNPSPWNIGIEFELTP